jgi:hypothetical protein
LTPNLTLSPPPYDPSDEITLDFQSAPVPRNRDEIMDFVLVLLKDPKAGIFWCGYWLTDFHDRHPLSKEDRNFWLGWIGQPRMEKFLDDAISAAHAQSLAIRNVSGKYRNFPEDYMIGMKLPAWGMGDEIVADQVFFYQLSDLMEKSHRLPASVLQLDYETALSMVEKSLREEGFNIADTEDDYLGDFSLIAEGEIGKIAVKVTTRRGPEEPGFTPDEVERLKRKPRASKFFMAPVGLLPVGGRSPEGHQGFHVKYDGLVEV